MEEKLSVKVMFKEEQLEVLMTSEYTLADLKDAIYVITEVEPYRQHFPNLSLPNNLWNDDYKVVDLNLVPDFVIQMEDTSFERVPLATDKIFFLPYYQENFFMPFKEPPSFKLSIFGSDIDEDAVQTSTSHQESKIQPPEVSEPLPDISKVPYVQPYMLGRCRRRFGKAPITVKDLAEELDKLSFLFDGSGDQFNEKQYKPLTFPPGVVPTFDVSKPKASSALEGGSGDFLLQPELYEVQSKSRKVEHKSDEVQPKPHEVQPESHEVQPQPENTSGKEHTSKQQPPANPTKSVAKPVNVTFIYDENPYFRREFKPLNRPRYGTKLVVLDVDQTLYDYHAVDPDFAVRPFLDEFLSSIYKHYEIGLWSETDMYCIDCKVNEMRLLENPNYRILFVMDKHAMIPFPVDGAVTLVKPLDVIWSRYGIYHRFNTVMCDDRLVNFAMNPRNGILIKPYSFLNHQWDVVLLKLMAYLNDIAKYDNLSNIYHNDWFRKYTHIR